MHLRHWLEGLFASRSLRNSARRRRTSWRQLPEHLESRTLLSASPLNLQLLTQTPTSPFSGLSTGDSHYSIPKFVDYDNDGDMDMVAGGWITHPLYFKNTGASATPHYELQTGAANPLATIYGQPSYYLGVALGDVDGDGDLDAFVSNNSPNYFRNTGTQANPDYHYVSGFDNPFNYVSGHSRPTTSTLIDLDADGDLDLVEGWLDDTGLTSVRNTGTPTNPIYYPGDSALTFIGSKDQAGGTPAFGDLDHDGDLDLVIGHAGGTFTLFTNVGSPTNPLFQQAPDNANPFYDIHEQNGVIPQLVDIDNDGDLDLVAGNQFDGFSLYTNWGTPTQPLFLHADHHENPVADIDLGNDSSLATGDLGTIAGNADGSLTFLNSIGGQVNPRFAPATGSSNPFSSFNFGQDAVPATTPFYINKDEVIVGNQAGNLAYLQAKYNSSGLYFVQFLGTDNPFNLVDVGSNAAPTMADLDNDGDFDLIVGDASGNLSYFRRSGDSTHPVFTRLPGAGNPFNSFNFGPYAKPSAVDLDHDGDIDVVIGREDGTISTLLNVGSKSSPSFQLLSGYFSGIDVGSQSSPLLNDWNGDGAYDLLVGNADGTFSYYSSPGIQDSSSLPAANPLDSITIPTSTTAYTAIVDLDSDGLNDLVVGYDKNYYADTYLSFYKNVGTPTNPLYALQTGAADPFAGQNFHFSVSVKSLGFADFNGDGKLDMLLSGPDVRFYWNSGTATSPSFSPANSQWAGTSNNDVDGNPVTFGDLDADGDLDLLMGSYYNGLLYFPNIGSPTNPVFAPDDVSLGNLGGFYLAASPPIPSLIDVDHDGDLDLLASDADGIFAYFKNEGTARVPYLARQTTLSGFPLDTNSGYYGFNVSYGDLDGDGDPDRIYAFRSSSTTPYLLKSFKTVSSDLQLTQSVNKSAPLEGDKLTFTVSLSNTGPDANTQIVIADSLPPGLTGLTVTPSIGTWSNGFWTVPSLPSGQSATLTITGTLHNQPVGTSLVNTAEIVASGIADSDSIPNNHLLSEDDLTALQVNVANSAPLLNPTGNPSLASIPEDTFNSNGTSIKDLIASSALGNNYITDPNDPDPRGIALYSAPSSGGNWQYTLNNGGTWNLITGISPTNALLLSADAGGNTRLRFVPLTNFNGTRQVYFRAWDQSAGTNGTYANITTNGGSTPFSLKADSATITVTPVNDAPLLFSTYNPIVPTVNKSAINNPGFKVSNMIASVSPNEYITDVDGGPEGIAIYQIQDVGGHWEYSLNNGTNWTSIGAVAANNALLLKSDASTYLRFVPNGTGTGDRKIFFRAWDQSTGTAGTKVDATATGLTNPFSAGADSLTLTVNTVNDAPVLNPAGSPTIPTISASNTNPAGISILDLIASGGANYITDMEFTDPKGIALYAAPSSGGTWQYSLDSGATWTNVGTVDQSHSLLLRAVASTMIRFKPLATFSGSRQISFSAWDQSTVTEGNKVDTNYDGVTTFNRGGTTAFSVARDTASVTVT